MPKWRNWQTRTFEGRVRQLVGVRVPPSAPSPLIATSYRVKFSTLLESITSAGLFHSAARTTLRGATFEKARVRFSRTYSSGVGRSMLQISSPRPIQKLFRPRDQYLVDPLTVHVHNLETQTVPLKVISSLWHATEVEENEAGQGLVVGSFFARQ